MAATRQLVRHPAAEECSTRAERQDDEPKRETDFARVPAVGTLEYGRRPDEEGIGDERHHAEAGEHRRQRATARPDDADHLAKRQRRRATRPATLRLAEQ